LELLTDSPCGVGELTEALDALSEEERAELLKGVE
jgi:hypothetical protein